MPDSDRFALVKVEGAADLLAQALADGQAAFVADIRANDGDPTQDESEHVVAALLSALGLDHTDWPTRRHLKEAQDAMRDGSYRALWNGAADAVLDEAANAIEQALQRAGGRDG